MLNVLLAAGVGARPVTQARIVPRAPVTPTAIIHIGPHKSGSTTIQDAVLGEWRTELMRDDNFAIPPLPIVHNTNKSVKRRTLGFAHAAFVLRQPDDVHGNERWTWLLRHVSNAASERRRVVITAEGLSLLEPSRANMVPRLLARHGYVPTVVICYRRLYERLPSWHSERWLKHDVPVHRYLPIADWVSRVGDEFAPQGLYQQTLKLRNLYSQMGLSVRILNLHAVPPGSSLVAEFVCEHMQASRTCARLRAVDHNRMAEQRKNANSRATAMLYDILYAEASARGLRHVATPLLVRELSNAGLIAHKLPARCPEGIVYRAIWAATAAEESEFNPAGLQDAHAQFERRRGSFCSVDVGALAANTTVQRLVDRAFKIAAQVAL